VRKGSFDLSAKSACGAGLAARDLATRPLARPTLPSRRSDLLPVTYFL
jgi:hypothetical protein